MIWRRSHSQIDRVALPPLLSLRCWTGTSGAACVSSRLRWCTLSGAGDMRGTNTPVASCIRKIRTERMATITRLEDCFDKLMLTVKSNTRHMCPFTRHRRVDSTRLWYVTRLHSYAFLIRDLGFVASRDDTIGQPSPPFFLKNIYLLFLS